MVIFNFLCIIASAVQHDPKLLSFMLLVLVLKYTWKQDGLSKCDQGVQEKI